MKTITMSFEEYETVILEAREEGFNLSVELKRRLLIFFNEWNGGYGSNVENAVYGLNNILNDLNKKSLP